MLEHNSSLRNLWISLELEIIYGLRNREKVFRILTGFWEKMVFFDQNYKGHGKVTTRHFQKIMTDRIGKVSYTSNNLNDILKMIGV